ncbi:UDP-N-acetylmuramate dehydrogenase [Litchfieldella xinjiangensis]|uniref:UDP-N-acetylmuramate dehydrogenase n=1 Tax=Litchfieldella xinjiangensis TaxID=1166948 RepID=UPI0005BCC457|nr:UDP-N-acetylmuramate dehydrogenase [Halomonas xinjiangensis]
MTLEIQTEHDLSGFNTLRLPCVAARYVAPTDPGVLTSAIALARRNDWPVLVLGGGSNLILGERLDGLVIQPAFQRWQLEPIRKGRVKLTVEAGMNWHRLVMAMAEQDLWGLENLALIPGHCGAAPIQNIGAYGVELSDILDAVHGVDLQEGCEVVFSRDECAFGYRDSIFKHAMEGRVAITHLELSLSTQAQPKLEYGDLARRVGNEPTPLEIANTVIATRQEKLPDPAVLPNAGSFFKNPVVNAAKADRLLSKYPDMPHFPQSPGEIKLAAGWLIDQCGLKGYRKGAFGVHEKQALVLVHRGGGSAQELMVFADGIARDVLERFGVVLEKEPRAIGLHPT